MASIPIAIPSPLFLISDLHEPRDLKVPDSSPGETSGRYRGKLVPRSGNDWMTRDEFKEIYGRLGGILHASNPLGGKVDYAYFEDMAPSWQDKYMNLLQHHKVAVLEEDMMYIVQMNALLGDKKGRSDGDVTVTPFQKIEPKP